MITKVFSIFFSFCSQISMIQNISVSALFTLIQLLFKFGTIDICFYIVNTFLQVLFENKVFIWIKAYQQIKGLIWDLAVTSIKYFAIEHINQIANQSQFQNNVQKMYSLVVQCIFNNNNKCFYKVPIENGKSHKNNSNHKQY